MKKQIVSEFKTFLGFPSDKVVKHSTWNTETSQKHCLMFLTTFKNLPDIFKYSKCADPEEEIRKFIEDALDYNYEKTSIETFVMDDNTKKLRVKVNFSLSLMAVEADEDD